MSGLSTFNLFGVVYSLYPCIMKKGKPLVPHDTRQVGEGSQRRQNPLIKEYTVNHSMVPFIVEARKLEHQSPHALKVKDKGSLH